MANRKLSGSTELAAEPADDDLVMVVDVSDATDGAGGTNKRTLWSTLKGLWTRHDLATAANDFLIASGSGVFVKKTLVETKAVLGLTIVQPAVNILTLTNAAASTLALNITAAKTLTLTATDNYALTVAGTASVAGTNTGDVTLAGTPDYLTISGQAITRALINLTTHVTGILPSANGGTGVNNSGTLTNATNTTITGGGTLALAGYTLTVPATGTAALLGTANVFTQQVTISGATLYITGTSFIPLKLERISDDANSQGLRYVKARGTPSVPTGIQSGDQIARFMAIGYLDDGTLPNAGSGEDFITVNASENYTSTARGRYTSFKTTSIGSINSTERLRIDAAGNFGFATTTPTNLLSLGGNAARIVWMERHTTSNTAGNTLTITAGGATASATNKAGGALILQGGLSTGSAESGVTIQGCVAGASGTADRTQTTMIQVLGNKIGLFSSTPVVQQTGCAVPTDLATAITAITALRTALNNYGLTTVV